MSFTKRARKYKDLYTAVARETKLFCDGYASMIRNKLKTVVGLSVPSIEQKEQPIPYTYVFVGDKKQEPLNQIIHRLYHDTGLPRFVKHIIDTELMRILSRYNTWREIIANFEQYEFVEIPVAIFEFDITLKLTKQQYKKISDGIETFVHVPQYRTTELLSHIVDNTECPIKISVSGIHFLVELAQLTRKTIQTFVPIADKLFERLINKSDQLLSTAKSVQDELKKLKRTFGDRYFVEIQGLDTKDFASELTAIYYGELMLMLSLLADQKVFASLVTLLFILYDLAGLRLVSVLSSLLYSTGKATDFDRIEIRQIDNDQVILSVPIIPENEHDLIYRHCGYLI